MHTLSQLALLALCSLGLSVAQAGNEVQEAERERLSDEMESLAKRQAWTGVEKKYGELSKLGIDLSEEDHLHGAYAARELGNVRAAYDRLKEAARTGGSKEIVDWLWDLDTNYGDVELISVPARTAELTFEVMPFDPNQRKAVDAAVRTCKSEGAFLGMLPRGGYTFAGQSFKVEPGISVRIEVSPRMRRQGLIDPVIIYRDKPAGDAATIESTRKETQK